MKHWLYLCTIYIFTCCTDQHVVVLEPVPKAEKSEETKHVDPSSQGSGSGEGIVQKSEENAESGEQSNDHSKQSSDSEKLDSFITANELSEGKSDSQSESADGTDALVKKPDESTLYIFKMPDHSQYNSEEKARKIKNWNRWVSEVKNGNNAEIMGTNPHIYQPDTYSDLGRRFVLQYPYADVTKNQTTEYAPPGQEIIPIQAPSQQVADKIARESALALQQQKKAGDDIPTKNLLRTGDFWNGVWKEDVDPKTALRSQSPKSLGVIKANIKPGSEFYSLVAKLKKISPRLLYIINEKKDIH